MKKSSVKGHKTRELDLLPVMNLFIILTVVMISMATFEKLGILELWLPERSMSTEAPPSDIDEGLLNLTVIISNDGLTLGASGGFQPTVYYQEEVEYRSKSDNATFTKVYVPGEVVRSPTDGKEMSIYEKEHINLNYIEKADSADPGRLVLVAVNHEDEPMLDSAGNWLKEVPPIGGYYRLVGDGLTMRTMDQSIQHISRVKKLSAYYEIARQLEQISLRMAQVEMPPPDADDVVVLAGESIIYDKVIQLMDACKTAGYSRVALSLVGGEV
jgi:biopolymer transport protein ExbD